MVSVAMCTYNGEKYITEQLESIAKQSCQVDELVICDDGSSDRTVPILRDFANKVSFPVRIYVNEVNLGSTKNFEKALELCQGSFLFLCDQDDVWREDKVERLIAFFERHPQYDAVFSNANLINDSGTLMSAKLWDNFGFDEQKQVLWSSGKANEVLFRNYIVTGATMAIRKTVLDQLAPFPTHLGPYIHDTWMALALGVQNKIGFTTETLMSYRIHESQQVGFGKQAKYVSLADRLKRDRKSKIAPIKKRAILLKDLIAALEGIKGIESASLFTLRNLEVHFRKRANLPENRLLRLKPVVAEAVRGRYKYSSEHWWLPLLGDLFE